MAGTTCKLATNRYGKSGVRLMRVTRHETHHDLDEWTVQVLLSGDFESAHTVGDNSKILPTDTMKNTVYFIARESKAATSLRRSRTYHRTSSARLLVAISGPRTLGRNGREHQRRPSPRRVCSTFATSLTSAFVR